MRRLDYVIRFVRDLDSSVAFYRDVLGLTPRVHGDGYVEFDMENVRFALYERGKLPELIGRAPEGVDPEGEVVFVVENVDVLVERFDAKGMEILSGPTDRPWGHRTVHVADPDGFIVEFAQNIPRTPPQ